MRALVTGGGGFLGRYIAEKLISNGWTVRSFSRGEYPELVELGVECARGSLTDHAAVLSACDGCDVVFHVAAIPGIWGPWNQFHQTNTEGTATVIDGCRKAGVGRLIYTSSPSVVYDGQEHLNAEESLPYPDEYLCHYPHSKALAEKLVLEANSDNLLTVSLRPHLIWGPRDNHLIPRLVRRARQGRLMQVGDGSNLISMSYVENTSDAHLQACDRLKPGAAHAGKAYFINEPDPVNLWEWVNQLLKLAELPPVKRKVSAKTAWRIGRAFEVIYGTLRIQSEPPMTRFLAQQLSSSHTYSIANARNDFGYSPSVSFVDAMSRLEPQLKQLGAG